MARLTVIADDLTGALDTGVQFANRCVSVRVAAVNAAAVPEEKLTDGNYKQQGVRRRCIIECRCQDGLCK